MQYITSLAVALPIGAAAVSLTVLPASLADNGPLTPRVRCPAITLTGESGSYAPCAQVTDSNGAVWTCASDGRWFRECEEKKPNGTRKSGGSQVEYAPIVLVDIIASL